MQTKADLHFIACKVDKKIAKTLKDFAWKRGITLKELLQEILTNYANEVGLHD